MDKETAEQRTALITAIKDALGAKGLSIKAPCSFCGGLHQRNLVGINWLGVQDTLGVEIMHAAPGHIPCAVFGCSGCGNMWFLNLLHLGIVRIVQQSNNKPTFTLIRGGLDDDSITNPNKPVT